MAVGNNLNSIFEFGDRILVSNPPGASAVNSEGIFISLEGSTLVWVGVGTTTGTPTLFVTNIDAHTVQKIS